MTGLEQKCPDCGAPVVPGRGSEYQHDYECAFYGIPVIESVTYEVPEGVFDMIQSRDEELEQARQEIDLLTAECNRLGARVVHLARERREMLDVLEEITDRAFIERVVRASESLALDNREDQLQLMLNFTEELKRVLARSLVEAKSNAAK